MISRRSLLSALPASLMAAKVAKASVAPEPVKPVSIALDPNALGSKRSYTHADLRKLSENAFVRLCIEKVKDELQRRGVASHQDRAILEDMLVLDAAVLMRYSDPAGNPVGDWIPVDGATIQVLVDEQGTLMGYQQAFGSYTVTWRGGEPWPCSEAHISAVDFIHFPRNVRPDSHYGYSPLEEAAKLVGALPNFGGEHRAFLERSIEKTFGIGEEARMLSFVSWLQDLHRRMGYQEVWSVTSASPVVNGNYTYTVAYYNAAGDLVAGPTLVE